ncbi:zinc finger, CCHC-type containing protein [Tanacetum coccineum]
MESSLSAAIDYYVSKHRDIFVSVSLGNVHNVVAKHGIVGSAFREEEYKLVGFSRSSGRRAEKPSFGEIKAMAEEDAFLVDYVEGGLCVDNTDAGIVRRCNSGSDKDKGKELWDLLESKYMAENSSSKKFLVSNFYNYKMVDSRPVMEQYNELLRILGQYTQHDLKMDESISVSSIIDKLPPSWKDFKHTLKHGKDDLSLVQLGSHLRIEESLRAQDSDKGKGKEVGGPSVNMTEEGKNKHNKENKGKKRSSENNSSSSSKKKPKLECWKCGKIGHFKRDCRSGNKKNANAGGSGKGFKDHSQDQDRCWFKTYEPVEDGSVLYMGDDHFAPIHGKGSVALEFSSGKSITLFNVLYVPKLRTDISKITRKQSKNGQARTRESEEFKKKPKNQSRSQKSQALSQIQSKMVKLSQTQKDKSSKCFTLVPQLSQKSKNVPSSLIGPRKLNGPLKT